jgi:hypothetical protein
MRHLLAAIATAVTLAGTAHAQPTVNVKAPKVVGPTNAEVVTRTMRRRLGQLMNCYDQSRTRDPKLRGTLKATFRVMPAGKVTAVRVEGVDNALENCAARVVRALRFPSAAAETSVQVAIAVRPPPAPKPVKPVPAALQGLFGAPTCTCPCVCPGMINPGLGGNLSGFTSPRRPRAAPAGPS